MSEPVRSMDAQASSSRAPAPWPRWSSDLHESLASQEASAAELRQELDDLRRRLDAAPARSPAPRRRPLRSRPLLAAGAAGVIVLAAAGVAAGAARSGSSPSSAPSGSPATSVTRTASTTTTATPTAARRTGTSGATATAPPLPAWPGQSGAQPPDLPAHGVGADASGTEVTATLSADRSVDVYERAVLARARPAGATLALRPAGSQDLGRSLQAPPPTIEDLHAEVDGRSVPVRRTTSGWTVATPSGTTVSRLVLRYRVSGALVRREPAPPGRYTLVLTPLAPSAGGGAGDAVVVRIRDPRIEEFYCPDATDQLCGTADGPLHMATVPTGAVPVVIALVTFPN